MTYEIRPDGDTNTANWIRDVTEGSLPQVVGSLSAGDYQVRRVSESAWATAVTVTASGDTTPPVLSSPTDTASSDTASAGAVTTDEGNGTLYWVVTTSSTSPSAAQIVAGQDNTGTAATASGNQAVSSTGVQNIAVTGLTASTAYTTHYMHRDAANNDSNIATASGFTTSAASGGINSVTPTGAFMNLRATGEFSPIINGFGLPASGGTAFELRLVGRYQSFSEYVQSLAAWDSGGRQIQLQLFANDRLRITDDTNAVEYFFPSVPAVGSAMDVTWKFSASDTIIEIDGVQAFTSGTTFSVAALNNLTIGGKTGQDEAWGIYDLNYYAYTRNGGAVTDYQNAAASGWNSHSGHTVQHGPLVAVA